MKDFEPHAAFSERSREHSVSVQELVREAGVEMARIRASTAALEALDVNEWQRAQRVAHDMSARAQALDLGVLATCARELERFAGVIAAGEPKGNGVTLQAAAIAIETIDLELAVLAKAEMLA